MATASTVSQASVRRGLQLGASMVKWLARGIAVLLALVWGAFFLEHVNEWYVQPEHGRPPLWVLMAMGLHLGFVLGLFVLVRWSLIGSVMTLIATLGFIALIAAYAGTPSIVLVNLVPLALLLLSRAMSLRARRWQD